MKHFAALLDRLLLTPSRNGKLAALVDYFRDTPDPDGAMALPRLPARLDLKSGEARAAATDGGGTDRRGAFCTVL